MNTIYTIGHSNHTTEKFTELLQQHHITAIADVRSTPWSRFHTQFNQEEIKSTLKDQQIYYVYLGEELGARRNEREAYQRGNIQFERIPQLPLFQKGIERLQTGSSSLNIALLCAEANPLECHRAILITRHLQQDHPIQHICKDGSTINQQQLEEELLSTHKLGIDLFNGPDQLPAMVENAYQLQAKQIAYQEESHDEQN
ncbi:MAG: DUF488 domain-containing protein [Gammaproteobacteria bacterium]|jgi:uncharacterized protein (DUF488 family)|nr:DUF488 domain-containing protein [Gammaproteobacteria bacterium]MBT4605622.1 DUF488 domain-containing protein [Thiotrichales bacterium]MBT7828631.1 DUF488 domain-containing protein [Candidatus Neomarinimicrobiota bacterium]MBT3473218.1 DUF488 domain-containing protein [Gammaproteobacteria bacterium]MBT3968173.1 DUF488 domain-containing protein [Gammaproteobacteria bacterium]